MVIGVITVSNESVKGSFLSQKTEIESEREEKRAYNPSLKLWPLFSFSVASIKPEGLADSDDYPA